MPENATLTDAQLAEIEARANAATPGPWYHMQAGDVVPLKMRPPPTYDWLSDHPQAGLHKKIIIQRGACYGGTDDYAFIAHARADVPTLIAALRGSGEREKRLREALVDAALRRCCDQVPPSATNGVGFMTLRDEAGHAVVHVDGCTVRAALGEEAPHA